jgi:hypothetical protein
MVEFGGEFKLHIVLTVFQQLWPLIIGESWKFLLKVTELLEVYVAYFVFPAEPCLFCNS